MSIQVNTDQSGLKRVKAGENGSKQVKTGQNGSELVKTDQNGLKKKQVNRPKGQFPEKGQTNSSNVCCSLHPCCHQ